MKIPAPALVATSAILFTFAAPATAVAQNRPWAEVAAWWEASATAAAVAAAGLAAVYAARAFGLEQSREGRWEEGQRRSQAALIAAWPAPLRFTWDYDETTQTTFPTAIEGVFALLRNASHVPVTDVLIKFSLVLRNERVEGDPGVGIGHQRLPLLAPGADPVEVELEDISETEPMMLPSPSEAARTEVLVSIEFRDAAGTRWHRGFDGRLSEITPDIA